MKDHLDKLKIAFTWIAQHVYRGHIICSPSRCGHQYGGTRPRFSPFSNKAHVSARNRAPAACVTGLRSTKELASDVNLTICAGFRILKNIYHTVDCSFSSVYSTTCCQNLIFFKKGGIYNFHFWNGGNIQPGRKKYNYKKVVFSKLNQFAKFCKNWGAGS